METLGKRILGYLDQDGRRPNDTPDTRRHLRFRDRDGGYELAGWLDREAVEIVRAALSPLAAPRPVSDAEIDLRTAPATRRRRPGLNWPIARWTLVTYRPRVENAPRSW